MKLSDLPNTAIEIARTVGNTTIKLVESCFGLILSPFRAKQPTRREEFRSTILEVRRLMRTAMAEGLDRDLARALNFLSKHDKTIQRAIIVWIDLIEVLIQNAEQRYGSTPGMGPLKAAEVKEMVRYLLRNRSLNIPDIPQYLQPVIVDLVVDWSVDVLVLMANRYGLWVENGSRTKPQTVLIKFRASLHKFIRLLFLFIIKLFENIRKMFQRPVVISPEIKAAIDAVEREGLIISEGQLFHGVADLLVWVSTRRKTLMILVEVVSAAVHEAEGYLSLSGPEKKAYARDLVLAVLDELGFEQRTGLLFAIIDSTINSAIEGSVHIFNKRGLFTHRSPA
ncbi:MAG: hypothetical protein AB1489_01250 [Acidobacteriota bacterium]